mmetsp:Transcript_61024/g.176728  ORF Transcript_61024/g.176728 Transcript_61024/m.176728 type:complete len:318 (+) Transcript_61024:127-1080(+)
MRSTGEVADGCGESCDPRLPEAEGPGIAARVQSATAFRAPHMSPVQHDGAGQDPEEGAREPTPRVHSAAVERSRRSRHPRGAARERPVVAQPPRRRLRRSACVLLFLCVADMFVNVPALWFVVIAEGGLASDPHTRIHIITWLAFSQLVMLLRFVSIFASFCSTECSLAFLCCVDGSKSLLIYAVVILQLTMFCVLSPGAMFEDEAPVRNAGVLGTTICYNVAMLVCHVWWLYSVSRRPRGRCPEPRPLVKRATTGRFSDLDNSMSKLNNQCPICLDEFTHGSSVMILPCRHVLHASCGQQWLTSGNQCPFRCTTFD